MACNNRCFCRLIASGVLAAWRLANTPIPGTFARPRSWRLSHPRLELGESSVPVYVIGSWFLHDCLAFVTATADESLHYVAAVSHRNWFFMNRMVTFPLAKQSVVRAEGDRTGTHGACVQADAFGHAIAGIFHSHPGSGAGATTPSSTDKETHERFERGGFPVIGGIFTRDGHVRFFSHRRPFQVQVLGDRVEEVSQHVYRLSLGENTPLPDGEHSCSRRGGRDCAATRHPWL